METMYYIGLDVHKRAISYCVKDVSGRVYAEGSVPATRFDLDRWMKTLPQPWTAAMEATVFTGWIYDHLQPRAAALKVAHPLMLRAIAAAKKKNDRIDAKKICDCLRCDFLPECYMASRRFANGGARCGTQLAGSADGADEEQEWHAADGSGRELQQAKAAQGRLLPFVMRKEFFAQSTEVLRGDPQKALSG
jgi:Transposase